MLQEKGKRILVENNSLFPGYEEYVTQLKKKVERMSGVTDTSDVYFVVSK